MPKSTTMKKNIKKSIKKNVKKSKENSHMLSHGKGTSNASKTFTTEMYN